MSIRALGRMRREDEKQVTGGERVRYRAGIEVDADGRTRVKRYNDGLQGPKHDVLYETPHGAVKITRPLYRSDNGRRRLKDEYVYVTLRGGRPDFVLP